MRKYAVKDREITVVGAGLAGLTAAINLARDGFEILVLDREERHGGCPGFRPDRAACALDLQAPEAYTGKDIAPACKHMDSVVLSYFGAGRALLFVPGYGDF